jgi:hypothetical protein
MNILQALDDPALYGAHPAFAQDPANLRPWCASRNVRLGLALSTLASCILAPTSDPDEV